MYFGTSAILHGDLKFYTQKNENNQVKAIVLILPGN